ncbi:MAG: zinc-ribbon domain-containing protein [Candidatus Heimdallarchaeota archaeon]|nr:zinc-ribbon domain-containing protein [Candidatus Heimdallarchaeota archaeon]
MSKGFCTHCGARLSEEADFCNNCGSKIEMVNGVPAAMPMKTDPHPGEYVAQAQPGAPGQTYYAPSKGHRPIKQRPKIIGYAIGIIFLIGVPFIVFAILGSLNLHLIGTLDFEVDSFAETNVILDINLDVGSLEIYYDLTVTNLVEATLDVWGRPEANIADAVNFELSNETAGAITVSFDSGDRSIWYWDKTTFNYDIVLYIHPSAEVDFILDAGTGSITLDTNAIDYLDIDGLYMDSGTGSLFLNMASSLNTSIQSMYLETGTGSINVNLGIFTSLNETDVLMKTGTGTITFAYEDLIVSDDITWYLDTGTGSINIDIVQNVVQSFEYETLIIAESGTGTIDVAITLDASIGLSVTAEVGTGSTDIFGSENDYESLNYDTAENTYTLMLDTGTGSVEVV